MSTDNDKEGAEKASSEKKETAKKAEKLAPFTVAKGKSLCVAKMILGEGEEVTAEAVGGKTNLDALIKRGLVDKN